MKDQLEILFSRGKQTKAMFLGVLILLFCAVFIYYILFVSEKIKITYLVLFVSLFVFGIVFMIKSLKSIKSDGNVGLTLDQEGLVFLGTPLAKGAGKLLWKDVTAINVGQAHGIKMVYLVMSNYDKYLQNMKIKAVVDNAKQHGISINASELDIDFEEMKRLIFDYYDRYKA